MLWRLAEAKPEVKEAFARVNIEHPESPEFAAHSSRILNALDMIINLLDHPEAAADAIEHLAHQHHGRAGVTKEHFQVAILSRVFFLEFYRLRWFSIKPTAASYTGPERLTIIFWRPAPCELAFQVQLQYRQELISLAIPRGTPRIH